MRPLQHPSIADRNELAKLVGPGTAAGTAADSQKAEKGTIRAEFGTNIERNAIHGSDSPENARIELNFFFSTADLI